MTDREKLIALYKEWWEAPFDDEEECGNCTKDISNCNECLYGKFADRLISHGVVVREKGEWIPVKDNTIMSPCYECSVCGRRINTFGTPQVCVPFCHCGADMRGEQHGT